MKMIAQNTNEKDICDICKKRIDDGEKVDRTTDGEFAHKDCFYN